MDKQLVSDMGQILPNLNAFKKASRRWELAAEIIVLPQQLAVRFLMRTADL